MSNTVKEKEGNDYSGELERNKVSMEAFHAILFNAHSVFTAMLIHVFKLFFSDLRFSFLNIFVLKSSHKSKSSVYVRKWSFEVMYKGT